MSPEQLLGELEREYGVVICDLEAGIGTTLRIAEDLVDAVVVVVEPTVKSMEVAERVAEAAIRKGAGVVVAANRIRDPSDVAAIRERVGDVVVVEIPEDGRVLESDRSGTAPIDLTPPSPAVRAIDQLASALEGLSG